MKRRIIIVLAVLAMLGLLGLAFAIDCLRVAAGHRADIALADDEVKKHEQRLMQQLKSSPNASPEVTSAIAAYESVETPTNRRTAYDEVVAAFRRTMVENVDPTDPLARKFMDDTAGAINRRQVALDPYDVETAEYLKYLSTFRGHVARVLSRQAAADYSGDDF
jgi:hypothetical protein